MPYISIYDIYKYMYTYIYMSKGTDSLFTIEQLTIWLQR